MSEAGQSAHRNRNRNGMRARLQLVSSWIGLRRPGRHERGEDLLADPIPDSVEFISLSPHTNSHNSGPPLTLIDDTWIRRHCDPLLYERAMTLVKKSQVAIVSTDHEKLIGSVQDGEAYTVEIRLDRGALAGLCGCDSYTRRRDTTASVNQRHQFQCAHIAALVQCLVNSGLMPQPGPADLAPLCPITRQTLDGDRAIYRCERCQISYSEEGWQFLRDMDHGRCCGCQSRNSIHALCADRTDLESKHDEIS